MQFERNKNIVERSIHDSFFLIDITQNYLDEKCRLYEINETGSYIWNRLSEMTPEAICDSLFSEVEEQIGKDEINNDVNSFIRQLISVGFIGVA